MCDADVVAFHNEIRQQFFTGGLSGLMGRICIFGIDFKGDEFTNPDFTDVIQTNGRHGMAYRFALRVQEALVGQNLNFSKEFHRAKLQRETEYFHSLSQKIYLCGMQHLVVLSGAGISAESGISTFRDAGGLWEGHRIEDVASPEGFRRDPQLVLDFYNLRRRQLQTVEPNDAHRAITRLEKHFNVTVVTQNVDDLHERAGNSRIVHLHGELVYGCSSRNRELREFVGYDDIVPGRLASDGSQLRPDIVWFGEAVPKMDEAIAHTLMADIFVVIGTSLEVYPAAGLLNFVRHGKPVYIVDPKRHSHLNDPQITVINKKATEGMKDLYRILVPDEPD